MLDTLRAKAKGFRTMIGAGAVGILGLASLTGNVDLTPVLHLFVSDENQVGLVLCLAAILFGVLRYYTNTPLGVTDPDDHGKNVDEGN